MIVSDLRVNFLLLVHLFENAPKWLKGLLSMLVRRFCINKTIQLLPHRIDKAKFEIYFSDKL